MTMQTGKSEVSPAAANFAILVAMAIGLYAQGRIWWCKFGDPAIYINDAWGSSHTSQHLFDPYTATHILHGVLFFWIAGLMFPRMSNAWRVTMAIGVEAAWEVFENSTYVIQQYRENTASLDYFGDSIANSLGDVAACALGYWAAARLGRWRSLAFFVAVELVLLIWIRDSLLLNIVMLVWPLDSIKQWQMGA